MGCLKGRASPAVLRWLDRWSLLSTPESYLRQAQQHIIAAPDGNYNDDGDDDDGDGNGRAPMLCRVTFVALYMYE